MAVGVSEADGSWFVYMVHCADGSLYTGIAKDVSRRVDEHNDRSGPGAKYTRSRQPVTLVYQETVASRSEAAQREYAIKRLTRTEKKSLIEEMNTPGEGHG